MKKFIKKLTTLFIVILLVSVICVGSANLVFAGSYNQNQDNTDTINYVSLGDSYISGKGLIGYENGGYLSEVEGAFPVEFAKYLSQKNSANVNLTQLALSDMRIADLLFLLNFDTTSSKQLNLATKDQTYFSDLNAFYTLWDNAFSYGDYFTFKNFTSTNLSSIGTSTKNDNLKEVVNNYQNSVKNADIITLSIGNTDINSFIYSNLINALGVMPNKTVDLSCFNLNSAVKHLDKDFQQEVLKLSNEISSLLSQNFSFVDNSESLVLIVEYAIVSFLASYKTLLDKIVSLNPNAEIIILGLLNTNNGFVIEFEDGTTLDIGEIQLKINKYINTYLSSVPAHKIINEDANYKNAKIYFAETGSTQVMLSQYALNYNFQTKSWSDSNNVSGLYLRNNLVQEFNNTIFNLVKDTFNTMLSSYGFALSKITIQDVLCYEQFAPYWESYVAGNASEPSIDTIYNVKNEKGEAVQHKLNYNRLLSASLYLAIEDAILSGANKTTLNINSIQKIVDGIDVVMQGVTSNITAENIVDVDLVNSKVTEAIEKDVSASLEYLSWKLKNSSATNEEMVSWMVNGSTHCKKHLQRKVAFYTSQGITPAISTAMKSEDSLLCLFNLFARLLIDNSLGCHPTLSGYNSILESVITAYENDNSVVKEYTNKISDIKSLLNEVVSSSTNSNFTSYNEYIDDLFKQVTNISPEEIYDYFYTNITSVINEFLSYVGLENIGQEFIEGFVKETSLPFEKTLKGNVSFNHNLDSILCIGGDYSLQIGQKLKVISSNINTLNLTDLQVEDVLYLLNNNANVPTYTKNKNSTNLGLKQDLINKISNSKIITLDFSTIAFNNIVDNYLNGNLTKVEWDLIENEQDITSYKLIVQEQLSALNKLGASVETQNSFKTALQAYLYNYLSYQQNYVNLVESISNLNPNAQIVVVGLQDAISKVINIDNYSVDLSSLGKQVLTLTNFKVLNNISKFNNVVFVNKEQGVTTQEFSNKLYNSINPTLIHDIASSWQSDNVHHWHSCSCGEKVYFDHEFVWVTDTNASVGVAGLQHQECKECGYKNGVTLEIQALPNNKKKKGCKNSINAPIVSVALLLSCMGFISIIKSKKEV